MDNADIILDGLNRSFIHVEQGLDLFGGQKNEYIEILWVVLRDGRKKIPEIRRYFEDKDMKGFTIEVHALKSVAANIGAEDLSINAKRMEHAAKAGDMQFVEENIRGLLHDYEILLENLEKALSRDNDPDDEDNGRLPELTANEWNRTFQRLKRLIDEFEQDEAIELVNNILHHRIENKDMLKQLKEIREYLEDFDFERALELLKINT